MPEARQNGYPKLNIVPKYAIKSRKGGGTVGWVELIVMTGMPLAMLVFCLVGGAYICAVPFGAMFIWFFSFWLKCRVELAKRPQYAFLTENEVCIADMRERTIQCVPKNRIVAMRICLMRYRARQDEGGSIYSIGLKPGPENYTTDSFIALMFDNLGLVKDFHGWYCMEEILTPRYLLIGYTPENIEALKQYLDVPIINEPETPERERCEGEVQAEREYRHQIEQARAAQEEIDRRQQAALQEAFMREQQAEKASDGAIPPENGTDEEENAAAP